MIFAMDGVRTKIPTDAEVIHTNVQRIGDGWYALIRFTAKRDSLSVEPFGEIARRLTSEQEARDWMTKKLPFVYCAYWKMWSRVLSQGRRYPEGPFVELNLTPVMLGQTRSETWDTAVRPAVIRVHGTARDASDKEVAELPPNIRQLMVDNLGEELTNRLLTEDFLPQIDFRKYKRADNGGAHLADIRKEQP